MYLNVNNPVNYQLQGFGQNGVRTISTDQLYIQGEYYRVLVAEEDSYVTAVSVLGDDLTAEFVYAGTTIYGLFTEVSVSSGSLTAYIAGPTDIEDVWAYINAYGQTNAARIEAADCAKDAIAPLLDKYYAKASLVMVPSLYKTSIVYSERPLTTDGQLAFTRSNDTATRVGPDGYIEKVRTNVVLQSNTFNTTWTTTDVTLTSGQAGYDATNNAWSIVEGTVNTQHRIVQAVSGLSSGTPYTFSFYVKAIGNRNCRLRVIGTATTHDIFFNLQNGTIQTSTAGTGVISSVGGGWYRCSVTASVDLSTVSVYLNIADASFNSIYAGDNTSGLLAQAAQLETGDIATNYIPTTASAVSVGPVANLPRLNYPINSDGSVGCPSLLLEPQRTNLAPQSEDFNGWSFKVNVTTTANYAVSPDGYTNADRLQFTGAGFMYGATGFIQTNGTTYTLSCYAKRNGSGTQSVGFFVNGSGVVNSAWTLTSEWQRFTYTYTASNNSSVGIAGANGADVSVYGFQFEAGAYATSYIPTLGAAVTRGADTCSKTGISSLIGQTEGTLFVEMKDLVWTASSLRLIGISDGSFSNRVIVLNGVTSDTLRVIVSAGGVSQASTTQAATFGNMKIALAYSSAGAVVYVNGTQLITTSAITVPATSAVYLGMEESGSSTSQPNGTFAQALLFKTRLTNQELQDLTTL